MDERIIQLESLKFVKQMGQLSELSFKHVYNTNQEFVDFTRKSMSQPKGVFKDWVEYVCLRSKPGHA